MTERIAHKKGKIREYIQLINSLKPDCNKKFRTDPVYRGALLHYLYLMADTCISLAEITIKHHSLKPPQSYQESFDILATAGILEHEFAYDFAKIAGFRHFLAHDYEEVKAEQICDEILNHLDEVEEFVRRIDAVN